MYVQQHFLCISYVHRFFIDKYICTNFCINLQLCTRHAQTIESADAHYKAVIRAFVAEALELSQFLDTVEAEKLQASQREAANNDGNKQNSMSVQNLDTLDFIDWVRLIVTKQRIFICNIIHAMISYEDNNITFQFQNSVQGVLELHV